MLDVQFGDVISGDRKKNPLVCCIHYKEILFCNDTFSYREKVNYCFGNLILQVVSTACMAIVLGLGKNFECTLQT